MKIIARNVGIDLAASDFKVCLMLLDENQRLKIKGTRKFRNNAKGFDEFAIWCRNKLGTLDGLRFTMEATGVYYEQLAYYLHGLSCYVSVLLPNKSNAFMQTLNMKSKTDSLEAKGLAQLGLERKFEKWEPSSDQMYGLKGLCRERVMLVEEKTMVSNRLHAELHRRTPHKSTVSRLEGRISFLDMQIREVEDELEESVGKDDELKSKIENITEVRGLGFVTVVTVVAETDGFTLFRNRSQLTSYSGYDVVERQSGSSVKGRTRISKKGNRYIRRALHMPSMSVVRYNDEFGNLYKRVSERTGLKMKGLVAVQRKLLLLIFTLFKKNEKYDPEFNNKKAEENCRQDTNPAYSG